MVKFLDESTCQIILESVSINSDYHLFHCDFYAIDNSVWLAALVDSPQNDFAHLRPLCYPDVDVVIICYSVVNIDSYEHVKTDWIKEVRKHCPGAPVVLVGTQVDKRDDPIVVKELKSKGKRPLTRSDGNKLLALTKATCYVECSAFTQFNVKNAFDEAIAAALELSSSSGKRSSQSVAQKCTIL